MIVLRQAWKRWLLGVRSAEAVDDAGLKTIGDHANNNQEREGQADPRSQAAQAELSDTMRIMLIHNEIFCRILYQLFEPSIARKRYRRKFCSIRAVLSNRKERLACHKQLRVISFSSPTLFIFN